MRYDICKYLLDNGADVNLPNFKGNTPLHFAYEKDNKELIDLFKENGAVEVANASGETPERRRSIARKLKDPNQRKSLTGVPDGLNGKYGIVGMGILSQCSKKGEIDKVKQLIESGGCNVNETDNTGSTPLHHAVYITIIIYYLYYRFGIID